MACELRLDDLPDDALKHVFHRLSTNTRRTISLTNHKWQRLVAESWTIIDVRLGGTNYLDSASLQIKWLLSLQLQHLQKLHLNLKGVELSGIAVDYLVGPLLDVLEQGTFSQLHTFDLAADMSLPGPLIHDKLQHLHLDMYALTATIQCPQLLTLKVTTTSMPGPTLFSTEALAVFQRLRTLSLCFQACYLDDSNASWFLLEGMGILTALQHVFIMFPGSLALQLSTVPAFPAELHHLELYIATLSISAEALSAVSRIENCLVTCSVLLTGASNTALATEMVVTDLLKSLGGRFDGSGFQLQSGKGPFVLA